MQFSAKKLQNNRLSLPLDLAHPQEILDLPLKMHLTCSRDVYCSGGSRIFSDEKGWLRLPIPNSFFPELHEN